MNAALIALLLASQTPPEASAKLKVIVLDLKAASLTPAEAQAITGLVTASLSEYDALEVVSGADVRQMLELEGQKQQLGCEQDMSCLAEIAGALGARIVAYGQIEKLGSRYLLNLTLQDTKAGKSVGRIALQGDSLDGITTALPNEVHKMTSPFLESEKLSTKHGGAVDVAPNNPAAKPPEKLPAKPDDSLVRFTVPAIELVKIPSIGPMFAFSWSTGQGHFVGDPLTVAGGVRAEYAFLELAATAGSALVANHPGSSVNGLHADVRAVSFALGPVTLLEPAVGIDLEHRAFPNGVPFPRDVMFVELTNALGLSWLQVRTTYGFPVGGGSGAAAGPNVMSVEMWLDVTSSVVGVLELMK
jgi:hypothetical protein